jgi:hypothetical protein
MSSEMAECSFTRKREALAKMTTEKEDRFHNQPESGSLSLAEHQTIEAGRLALSSLSKTFDLWVTIARAIKTLRDKADRMGGRWDFQRLMAQNGFRMDGTPHEKVLDKAIVSKLLTILDRLPEVMAWYEKLTPKQKREWAAPTTVLKHCPVFAKPKVEGERKPTKLQRTEEELAKAVNENYKLKQREDRDTFNAKTTSPKEMATALFGQLMPYPGKAEKFADAFLALVRAQKKSEFKARVGGGLVWIEKSNRMRDETGLPSFEAHCDGPSPKPKDKHRLAQGRYVLEDRYSQVLSAGGLSSGKFNGFYSCRYLPEWYSDKDERDLGTAKTAEKAKAIAQAHHDKAG